jgi:hypothetical protein
MSITHGITPGVPRSNADPLIDYGGRTDTAKAVPTYNAAVALNKPERRPGTASEHHPTLYQRIQV